LIKLPKIVSFQKIGMRTFEIWRDLISASPKGSPKRLIDGRALTGEEFRTLRRDVGNVLEAHAELAIDHDRRFDAEAQAGLNRSFVSAHDVRPFVTVQTNAMARAMRKTWNFVTGPNPASTITLRDAASAASHGEPICAAA
jgi:hypothetical protein